VIGLVLRRGTGRAVVGLGVGLCVTLIGAPRLGTLLYGVRPADPGTLALSTALLLGVAGLACWLPGRRAARIAPVEAMAAE
jgi:ABC-type antimicrobial peptide transport system permease subunit